MQTCTFFFSLLFITVNAASPKLQIGKTVLIGREIATLHQEFFGGIPYAEPPLGSLRLKDPVLKPNPDSSANGTFDASNFGKACLQSSTKDASNFSEDCLTINVLRPAGLAQTDRLPVLFWTYGGGFDSGASSIFNGSGLVAESVIRGTPIIYVNYNYRLGPLGFPQGDEADKQGALNLGMKDQLVALQWVNQNIEAFGGDKEQVTVFGESAGSIMTAALFLNSSLQQYARAAIFESGSANTASLDHAGNRQTDWANFVRAVPSCASVANSSNTFSCLQNATADDITKAVNKADNQPTGTFTWSPTLDGPKGLIPDLPSKLWLNGQFAKLPFIAGTNLDEGTLFLPDNVQYTDPILRASITKGLASLIDGATPQQLTDAANHLLELYPDVPTDGSPFNTGTNTFGVSSSYKRASALEGDIAFQAPRRAWIQAAAKSGVEVYGYLFTDPSAVTVPRLGVSHASEIPFVYGADPSSPVSKVMMNYWISFATSLSPNDGKGASRPQWTSYTAGNASVMQLTGSESQMIKDDYRAQQIDYINSLQGLNTSSANNTGNNSPKPGAALSLCSSSSGWLAMGITLILGWYHLQ